MSALLSMSTLSDYSGTLLVFVVIFALTYLSLRRRGGSRRSLPPALPAVPILGSMPFIPSIEGLLGFFEKTTERLGPVFSLYMGSDYTIVLNGWEIIQEALVKKSSDFASRKPGYTVLKFLNKKQLGIIEKPYGPSFRKYHQLTLNILKEFGFGQNLMEQRILIEAEALVNRIKNKQGHPFDPTMILNTCTLNVIASIVFGTRVEQDDENIRNLADSLHKVMNSERRHVDFSPILRFLPRYKAILEEASRLRETQKEFIVDGIRKSQLTMDDSFVKLFCEKQGANYDEEELVVILYDLLIAGSETTATSLQWALMLLANDQEIQSRLRQDIASVVPMERYPSLDDAAKLPFVEAAILELMRIKTVLPLSLIRLTMADTEVGGYFVPVNTRIIVNLHSAHMNPVDWPEPEIYRPERFLNEAGKVVGKERVIPFSLGKRSCLGELLARQEIFLLFTAIVQRFHILPPKGTEKIECKEAFMFALCPTYFEVCAIPN